MTVVQTGERGPADAHARDAHAQDEYGQDAHDQADA